MTIQEKISALRKIMEREGLDAYIISGTDPHNSEYLPEAWQQRKWISGFTGSYGTVVITRDEAGLWTDTRYFIQAEKELNGSGIRLHKLRIPEAVDYPDWLAGILPAGSQVGFDSFCMPVCEVRRLKHILSGKQIQLTAKTDLLGEIWLDRPALPLSPVMILDKRYAGKSAKEKIKEIQIFLEGEQADYIIFSSLDEIAWLYNIRSQDIPYNPVCLSYAVIGKADAWLFVNANKLSPDVQKNIQQESIKIRDYHHLFLFLDELAKQSKVVADATTLNYAIFQKLKNRFEVIETASPIVLKKAIKNPIEIEGFRQACVIDGIAMVKFFYWLEQEIVQREITETEAAEKLSAIRAEHADYVSDSFQVISAYGKNAALPHYSAVPGKDAVLRARGLYLVDSGGQYYYGTTDITRTIPLGELSELEKEDYTLVLKGMIALARCIFPKGTTGANIDILARQPLWNHLRNYGHGTGHGIGHFLCVHEGPQDIRQNWRNQSILPGMVTSDEPGMYREGLHGVRHENMILCKDLCANEFGEWCAFETLTLCYFDTSAILSELLIQEEKEWLNQYHRLVYQKLSPGLSPEEKEWLRMKTKEI